ncbi:MAG TPA: homoserine kinase [Vicinamibacterales bacterium]|nr:homoserine kinase [Vicinamibacterales bacterium]
MTAALRAVPKHAGPRVSVAQARARIGGSEIAVPASAANLGPGFDTLAVALTLYLRVRISGIDDTSVNGLSFEFSGTPPADNYVERAFRTLATAEGLEFPSLTLDVDSDIPMQAGLGSSAAATVAGLLLYDRLAGPLAGRDLLGTAARLEGHADNVSAALLGGLTMSCVDDEGRVIARTARWPDAIGFVAATPAVAVPTTEARRVLPDAYPRADAVFNLQRALLFMRAVQDGEVELLREALRDRWHQPYRAALVPGLEDALALRHPNLLGVCLSGSGPTVLALCRGETAEIASLLSDVYRRRDLPVEIRTLAAHQPVTAS